MALEPDKRSHRMRVMVKLAFVFGIVTALDGCSQKQGESKEAIERRKTKEIAIHLGTGEEKPTVDSGVTFKDPPAANSSEETMKFPSNSSDDEPQQ
jgi:hypothetical protein